MALSKVIWVTPTVGTAIYASGDQMGPAVEIPEALDNTSGAALIETIVVVDSAKQSAALELLFFRAAPTITSTDNNALDIADSEMVSKLVGRIAVPAAGYVSTNVNSDTTIRNIGLRVQGTAATRSLWVVLQSLGTPTYAAATDLKIGIGLTQD